MSATVERFPELLTLEVTSDHITRGTPRDPYTCPIAQALTDAGYAETEVDDQIITLRHDYATWEDSWRYDIGETGFDFMNTFDEDKPVKPTTLRLIRLDPLPYD